jgi:Cell Wall Hydrolase
MQFLRLPAALIRFRSSRFYPGLAAIRRAARARFAHRLRPAQACTSGINVKKSAFHLLTTWIRFLSRSEDKAHEIGSDCRKSHRRCRRKFLPGAGSTYKTDETLTRAMASAPVRAHLSAKAWQLLPPCLQQNIIQRHVRPPRSTIVSLKPLSFAVLAALALPSYAMVAGQAAPLADSGPQDPSPQIAVPILRYTPKTLEIETVAACLVLEAASQGPEGMRGVMAVIRNRSHGLPELFEPVVLKRRQFSAFNRLTAGYEQRAHAIQRARRDRMWENALALVEEAQSPAWRDPTAGATHYTRSNERNRWTRMLEKTVTIGGHSFYK